MVVSRHCKCHVCSFLLSSLPLDLGLTPPVPSRPVRPSSQKAAPPPSHLECFPQLWGLSALLQLRRQGAPCPRLGRRMVNPGSLLTFHGPFCTGLCRARWCSSRLGWSGKPGFPQAMTAAPRRSQRDWDSRGDTCGAVYLHRRCSRRRIPGVAGWGRRAARRSRASCAAPRPPSWPRAHPSLLLPPSLVVTAWAPAQINFLDIFKTAAAGSLCAPGTLRWARRRVSHPGA